MKTSKSSTSTPRSARVQRKRERSRQEILSVARRQLLASGVDSVTLAAVSGELGLTKQALYHYFQNKEALLGSLVASLLNEEVEAILDAIESAPADAGVLGIMIRTFYKHYIHQLDVFRVIYCQTQISGITRMGMNETIIRDEVNPTTRNLFDVLERRLCKKNDTPARRRELRRLAFSAWLAALGLITMLGTADAANDPLVHKDKDLLETLAATFDESVRNYGTLTT